MIQTTTSTSSNLARQIGGEQPLGEELLVSARNPSSQRRRHCRRRSVSAAAIRTRTQRSPLTATERDHAIGGGTIQRLRSMRGASNQFPSAHFENQECRRDHSSHWAARLEGLDAPTATDSIAHNGGKNIQRVGPPRGDFKCYPSAQPSSQPSSQPLSQP